jgi:hypothetical protein
MRWPARLSKTGTTFAGHEHRTCREIRRTTATFAFSKGFLIWRALLMPGMSFLVGGSGAQHGGFIKRATRDL